MTLFTFRGLLYQHKRILRLPGYPHFITDYDRRFSNPCFILEINRQTETSGGFHIDVAGVTIINHVCYFHWKLYGFSVGLFLVQPQFFWSDSNTDFALGLTIIRHLNLSALAFNLNQKPAVLNTRHLCFQQVDFADKICTKTAVWIFDISSQDIGDSHTTRSERPSAVIYLLP